MEPRSLSSLCRPLGITRRVAALLDGSEYPHGSPLPDSNASAIRLQISRLQIGGFACDREGGRRNSLSTTVSSYPPRTIRACRRHNTAVSSATDCQPGFVTFSCAVCLRSPSQLGRI